MEDKLSASGVWAIRYKHGFELNGAGYGNGSWSYELIEVATGRVAKTWTGFASQSPWDSYSSGVRNMNWDGDILIIEYAVNDMGSTEERMSVEEALARKES